MNGAAMATSDAACAEGYSGAVIGLNVVADATEAYAKEVGPETMTVGTSAITCKARANHVEGKAIRR